ncbi:glutaredoxin family protein [Microbacterium sp. NPDC055683]
MTATTSTFAVDIDPALTPDPSAVIVLSGPGCQQCRATHRHLDARGVAYVVRDATELPQEAIETLRQKGLGQLPVVVWPEGQVSSGYRPDLIDARLDLPKVEVSA